MNQKLNMLVLCCFVLLSCISGCTGPLSPDCIMQADGYLLYNRPNQRISGLYCFDYETNENKKINSDLPEDFCLLGEYIAYTTNEDTVKLLDRETQTMKSSYTIKGDLIFENEIEYSGEFAADSKQLKIAGYVNETLILYRVTKDHNTEFFQFNPEENEVLPILSLNGTVASDACVYDDGYFILTDQQIILVNSDKQIVTVYSSDEDLPSEMTLTGNEELLFTTKSSKTMYSYDVEEKTTVELFERNHIGKYYSKGNIIYYIDESHDIIAIDYEGEVLETINGISNLGTLSITDRGIFAYVIGDYLFYYDFSDKVWTPEP